MRNAVSVIVRNGSGHILLQKRNTTRFWGLPGGIVEHDESSEAAAIREVKEETGISIRLQGMVAEYVRPQAPKGGDHVRLYLAAYVSGDLAPDKLETSVLAWAHPDTLPVFVNPYLPMYLHDYRNYTGTPISKKLRIDIISEFIGKALFLFQDFMNLARDVVR